MKDTIKSWQDEIKNNIDLVHPHKPNVIHNKVYSLKYTRSGLCITAVIIAPNLVKAKLTAQSYLSSLGFPITVNFDDLEEIATDLLSINILSYGAL